MILGYMHEAVGCDLVKYFRWEFEKVHSEPISGAGYFLGIGESIWFNYERESEEDLKATVVSPEEACEHLKDRIARKSFDRIREVYRMSLKKAGA